MRQSLLDLTQNVLSGLSSDEVNSIGDTVESMQVATIIKNKFYDIVARDALPEHEQIYQLEASTDVTSPVLMFMPNTASKISWIKYLNEDPAAQPQYQYVTALPIQQFIDHVSQFNPDDTDVESFTFTDAQNGLSNAFTFYYKNNQTPQFCTVINNYYVIFDCFDASLDSTLQKSKTMVYGLVSPIFLMEDDFIPNLQDNQFPLLLNEAKALAYFELKQTPHIKAEQEIKRQWSSIQKNKAVSDKPSNFDALPNFGRQGGLFSGTPNIKMH